MFSWDFYAKIAIRGSRYLIWARYAITYSTTLQVVGGLIYNNNLKLKEFSNIDLTAEQTQAKLVKCPLNLINLFAV